MKKLLGVIIALLVIIIVLISVAFYTYVRNNENNNQEFMVDGPGYDKDDTFYGHKIDEWEKLISKFFEDYYGISNANIECYYNDNNDFVATVSTQYEVTAEYTFDSSNGLATEKYTGDVIDFINGMVLPSYSGNASVNEYVDFTDNQCLAIGYVTDLNEAEFVDKYFPDGSYGMLDYHDFRYPDNRKAGYGNKFVLIPKNNNVKITVYDCYIGSDGELYTDNTLISEKADAFILLDDYIEYTPSMCIKFEYNGFEEMFPISFSGEDGTLNLKGYEMEVKDISLY